MREKDAVAVVAAASFLIKKEIDGEEKQIKNKANG